jgi:hypothetical protein
VVVDEQDGAAHPLILDVRNHRVYGGQH